MKKRILLSLITMALLLPAGTGKISSQPKDLTFPDSSVVDEWFNDISVKEPGELGKIYKISDFGAVSDAQRMQTALIQSVIDKAAEEGGGVVVIPEGIFKSGALFFKQGTHLYMSRGAVLLGSESIMDFPIVNTRIEGEICRYFPALINADGLDGFTLTGPGIIDGNGAPYWAAFWMRRQWNPECTNKDEQRPRLVHISNCKNVVIANVTLENSPFWTCHVYKTDHAKLINVRIFSPLFPSPSASADGIDLDVCSNILVKGCRITVNDDAVCFKGGKGPWADTDPANGPDFNILIEDVFFDNTTGSCVTCGSECIRTHNILIRNCIVENGRSFLQLKMRPDTPQYYEYIVVDGIKGSCSNVINVAPWTQFFDLRDRKDIPHSYGKHIILRNIDLECKKFAILVKNDEQYTLDDFTFKNLKIRAQDAKWNREAVRDLKVFNTSINGVRQ